MKNAKIFCYEKKISDKKKIVECLRVKYLLFNCSECFSDSDYRYVLDIERMKKASLRGR